MPVTWNPSDKNANIVLSNNDLTAGANSTAWKSVRATEAKSSGKWYFEVAAVCATGNNIGVGVMQAGHTLSSYVGNQATGWAYLGNPLKVNNASLITYGVALFSGDIVMTAVDLDNAKIWWGKNGTWFASGNPAAGTNAAYTNLSGTLYPACSPYSSTETITARFKAADFSYSLPSGFSAWEYEAPQVDLSSLIQIASPIHSAFTIARLGL